MSRIAKQPVNIESAEVTINGNIISVKGSVGSMDLSIHPLVQIEKKDDKIIFSVKDDSKEASALSGTFRALVQNMITGTTKGFERKLHLVGVGYRAKSNGKVLDITVGYSHLIKYTVPSGVEVEMPSQVEIVLKSYDKQLLGQTAAEIRSFRKPDAYKGKGIRFEGEVLYLKEAKKKA